MLPALRSIISNIEEEQQQLPDILVKLDTDVQQLVKSQAILLEDQGQQKDLIVNLFDLQNQLSDLIQQIPQQIMAIKSNSEHVDEQPLPQITPVVTAEHVEQSLPHITPVVTNEYFEQVNHVLEEIQNVQQQLQDIQGEISQGEAQLQKDKEVVQQDYQQTQDLNQLFHILCYHGLLMVNDSKQ